MAFNEQRTSPKVEKEADQVSKIPKRLRSVPELQWEIFQAIKASPLTFYTAESSEEFVQEVITEVLASMDDRIPPRQIIFNLIEVIQDCTNWYDLDENQKRCLADHHMTRLLEVRTQYQLAHIMRELRSIGCVIERLDDAGGDDRPLMRNIQNM